MMSTTTTEQTTTEQTMTPKGLESRVLNEGYGPGAWHGPDLKAALADVTSDLAFWRPSNGRHNIAEIALHHAFCARAVRGQLSGTPLEPFVLDGEDWFALPDESVLPWSKILAAVESEQQRLAASVADIGQRASPMADAERFNLVLGITCHAVYHAGQVQLIKRLHAQ
jgi:DinB superfamily